MKEEEEDSGLFSEEESESEETEELADPKRWASSKEGPNLMGVTTGSVQPKPATSISLHKKPLVSTAQGFKEGPKDLPSGSEKDSFELD